MREPRPEATMSVIRERFLLVLVTCTTVLASAELNAGSTRPGELFMPQGGAATTDNGDFIMATPSPGLGEPYHYFIEVPPNLSQLVVELFDADVGAGGGTEAAANRDRARSNPGNDWNTTATYTLYNPSGTSVATLIGNETSPAGADNSWLTLYTNTTYSTPPAYDVSTTATASSNVTTLTINRPGGATTAGHILVALIVIDGGDGNITPPSDAVPWTELDEGQCNGDSCRIALFYKVTTATAEPASYSFTWPGGGPEQALGGVIRYSGVDVASPIDGLAVANGTSNAPTAPAYTTTVANTRVVRLFGANNTDNVSPNVPTGHTGRFSLESSGTGPGAVSGAAADTTRAAVGSTGTAAFSLNASQAWHAVTLAIRGNPTTSPVPAGHWELRVDQTAGGNDLNAFGIRAHDGTAGSGGSELPVYYHSHSQYGTNEDQTRNYTLYPYITSGCSCSKNDFDYDSNEGTPADQGQIDFTSRLGTFTQSYDDAQLAANDVWRRDSFGPWTSDTDSEDYGIWTMGATITYYGSGGNYSNIYVGDYTLGGSANPASAPTTNDPNTNTHVFRVYLPTDALAAPAKPYMMQNVRHVSGPNPPGNGETEVVTVTVSVVNPTANAITFSPPSNIVTVNVPGATGQTNGTAFYVGGSRQNNQGTWVSSELADGGSGDITWDPGTVASGATAYMSYEASVTPSNTTYDISVVGRVASGTGTRGQWVDETGNTSQSRATYLFGPLCEIKLDGGVTPAVVSELWGESDPRGLIVGWETYTEVGTAGFELWRWDQAKDEWTLAHEGLLPGLFDAPQGGEYRFLDRDVSAYDGATYTLVEVDSRGARTEYGPFEVRAAVDEAATKRVAVEMGEGFIRQARLAKPLPSFEATEESAFGTEPERAPRPPSSATLKIGVDQLAVYVVASTGMGTSTGRGGWGGSGSTSLTLTNRGQQVPWIATPAKDGILFVGEGLDSVYSRDNVYWLGSGTGTTMESVNGGSPLPASGEAGFQATVHAEEDRFPAPGLTTDPESDYWHWEVLSGLDPALTVKSFEVEVPWPLARGSAQVRASLFGATSSGADGEHHAVVRLNGVEVGDTTWQGIGAHSADFSLDPSILQNGVNTIEVEARLDDGVPYSIFYVDGFDISYPRLYRAVDDSLVFTGDSNRTVTVRGFSSPTITVFDITSPRKVKVLRGVTTGGAAGDYSVSLVPSSARTVYLAVSQAAWRKPHWIRTDTPSTLTAATQGADYLVVAGDGLADAARELASYRHSRDLSTAVVSFEDVMDQFNFGISDPNALRRFLVYAAQNWRPAPRYVVLAGAGTLDYRDVLGKGGNLLPPLMAGTWYGLFASDNRFADVVGDDGVPDLAIGRIPVRSAAELRNYIGRVREYEALPTQGWGERALWLADRPGGGFEFSRDAETLLGFAPGGVQATRIYLGEVPVETARRSLLGSLNSGAGLVNYVGHGALDRLSAQGLLTNADVGDLVNGSRAPVFVALTCSINRFELPLYPSLGQTLLTSPHGGAIAVWGPSGLSVNADACTMGKTLLSTLAAGSGRLGDAILLALRSLGAGSQQTTGSYIFLGDPGLTAKSMGAPVTPGGTGGGRE